MVEILRAPDRLKNEVRGIGGVLAYLWRSILDDLNIGLIEFDHAVLQYVTKARKQQSTPKIANYFSRSNIFREMSRPSMTFKVFLKGLQLLGVNKMKFTVEFERRGRVTVHSASVTLQGEGINYEDFLEGSDENEKNIQSTPSPEPAGNARSHELGAEPGKQET